MFWTCTRSHRITPVIVVGWLVSPQNFSKTAPRIFFILCMEVHYYEGKKRAEKRTENVQKNLIDTDVDPTLILLIRCRSNADLMSIRCQSIWPILCRSNVDPMSIQCRSRQFHVDLTSIQCQSDVDPTAIQCRSDVDMKFCAGPQ